MERDGDADFIGTIRTIKWTQLQLFTIQSQSEINILTEFKSSERHRNFQFRTNSIDCLKFKYFTLMKNFVFCQLLNVLIFYYEYK